MSASIQTPTLAGSYAYCERLARREAGNFYHAFRLLPGRQRRAMCALYAFLRIADDIGDGDNTREQKETSLTTWQLALDQALAGTYRHRLHPALHHTVEVFQVPREYLVAVLDGIRMDLVPVRYRTFADLYRYCYHVASAVGLACIHIWGFTDDEAKIFAESAGVAFQLTNILRDLGEDAARDRIYLPTDDLERFGYTPDQLRHGERDHAFRELMRFQAERANHYYDDALHLVPLLRPEGQAVFTAMLHTYRGLLGEIVRRDFDVFSGRVHLSRWWKVGILLRALPVRWGLA